MFGNDERDMMAALATMERLSRERSNFNQTQAKETFKYPICNRIAASISSTRTCLLIA